MEMKTLCLFVPGLPEGYAEKLMDLLCSFSDRTWQRGSSFYMEVESYDGELLRTILKAAVDISKGPVGIGAAEGQTLAHLAARLALGREPISVPKGMESAFLGPIPLRMVLKDSRILRRLALLGIHTLGDLASTDPSLVNIHLGRKYRQLIRLAKGEYTSASPALAKGEIRRKIRFQEPPSNLADLLQAIRKPIATATLQLRNKGIQPEQLELEVHLQEGATQVLRLYMSNKDDVETTLARLEGLFLRKGLSGHVSSVLSRIWGERAKEEQLPLLPLEGSGTAGNDFQEVSMPRPRNIPLRVKADSHGYPISFNLGGRAYRVLEVIDRWRIDLGWWDVQISKDLFKVVTSDGSLWTLSRDLSGGEWYLDKMHD